MSITAKVTTKHPQKWKPAFEARQLVLTTMEFFDLDLHPSAYYFEKKVDGSKVGEGVVRKKVVKGFKEGDDIVALLFAYEGPVSLPSNACYWPVPKEALTKPEMGSHDLFSFIPKNGEWHRPLQDPDYTLIHKSPYDHQVWDIEGNPVLMPLYVKLWGTRFDLPRVEKYLQNHPMVMSFEIVKNDCWHNYDISGTHLGNLVIDLVKLVEAGAKRPKDRSWRNWVEDNVINNYSENEALDYLGLAPFRRSSD